MSDAPTTMQWIRAAVRRISRGSGRLTLLIARRITMRGAARLRGWGSGVTGWLGQATGLEWLFRLGCLIVLGLVARRALLGASDGLLGAVDTILPRLMWPASAVWVIVAYRIGREDWQPRSERQPDAPEPDADLVEQEPADDEPTGAVEDAKPVERPLPTASQLALALHEVGDPHAQFVPLAAVLGTTTDRVREACAAAGIPWRDGVRMRGRSSSAGVARDDFPPRPALPSPTQPDPGESLLGNVTSNNNGNNATISRAKSGAVIITDDPANPYRHYVHYAKD